MHCRLLASSRTSAFSSKLVSSAAGVIAGHLGAHTLVR